NAYEALLVRLSLLGRARLAGARRKKPPLVGGAKARTFSHARESGEVLSRAYPQLGAVELVPVVPLRGRRGGGGGFEAQLAELPSNAFQLLGRSHLRQSINHGSERLDMSLGVLGEAGAFLARHGHPPAIIRLSSAVALIGPFSRAQLKEN